MSVKIPLPNVDDLPEEIREMVSSSPLNVVKMMANAPASFLGFQDFAAGAATIMMVGAEGDAKRLEMAERLGADLSVNITHDDPVKRARGISPRGLDIVYEATGNPNSIAQALNMVRNGGKVILVGIHSGPATFDPTHLVRSSKSIIGAYAYTVETWQRAIELFSNGIVDPEAVISHRVAVEEADKGFQLAIKKEALKVLFIP